MNTRKLTMGQATVQFLTQQYVERDGIERAFFAGMFGIFGHGNVAGIGQALHQYSDVFRFYQTRNEQSMVHTAAAYAKMSNRLSTFACTSSIGPGATNMLTGAAGATINRLPLLIFLKSTQKSVSINGLSIRGYENAKKCQLICPQYVKNIPYFQYKIE